MKITSVSRLMLYLMIGNTAFAQNNVETLERVRACATMDRAERVECLDRLSRQVTSPTAEPQADGWVVSETRSPVDYSPVVTATLSSREAPDRPPLQLSIRCRNRRADVVISGIEPELGGLSPVVSYQINNQSPVQIAAGAPTSGSGIALTGNVVGFLQSLPEDGDLSVQISARNNVGQRATFPLRGIQKTRQKIAAACNW